MRGGRKWAKPACGRPLDGGGSAFELCTWVTRSQWLCAENIIQRGDINSCELECLLKLLRLSRTFLQLQEHQPEAKSLKRLLEEASCFKAS